VQQGTGYDCAEDIQCTVYTMDAKLELSPPKKIFFSKNFSTNNNQMVIENNPLNYELDISPI
jgi:hypothetical protein